MEIIAQATPDTTNVMQVLGPLGVAVILAWYLWYTVSVILPNKDRDFYAAMEKKDGKHEAVVNSVIEQFRSEAKEARASESERLKISSELARSGHAGINNLVSAINELKLEMKNKA